MITLKQKEWFQVFLFCQFLIRPHNGDVTTSNVDHAYHSTPCNVWRPGDPDLNTFDIIRNYRLEQYDEELVHRVIGSNDFQTAYHIKKFTNLTIEITQAFPHGLPHEFTFECTFRTETPPSRPWYLFSLSDYEFSSLLSMVMNPLYGTIDLSLQLYDGTFSTVSFIETKVFNGRWHKIILDLTQNSINLWVDCSISRDKYGRERVSLEKARANIESTSRYFTIAQDIGSGSTVPIDLQWMILSCNSVKPNHTNCKELPQYDLRFEGPVDTQTEPEGEAPILMASAGRARTCPETCPPGPPGRDGLRGPPGPPGPTPPLSAHKGQKGEPGLNGLPGQKGESIEASTSGFLEEISRTILQNSSLKGEKGEPGEIYKLFLDDYLKKTEVGKEGDGANGIPEPTSLAVLKGQKGEPGNTCPCVKDPYVEAKDEKMSGYPGPSGPPGPPGPPGLPSLSASYQFESEIRDICMGVVREYIAEIQTTLIGAPGPPGKSIVGRSGRPGPMGPPGEQGPKGQRGERGFIGPPGKPGIEGKMGPPGADGIKGDQGFDGIGRQGPPGLSGTPGIDGPPGVVGAPGRPGERGSPGTPGLMGPQGPPGQPGTCPSCIFASYPQFYQQHQTKGPENNKG